MSTEKSIELLGLPQEAAPFNGRITTKTTRSLVIIDRFDFTQTESGFVKSTYYEIQVNAPQRMSQSDRLIAGTTNFGDSLFGAYCFNWMANWIHSFNYNVSFASPTKLVLSKGDGAVEFNRNGDSIVMDTIFEVDPSGNPLTTPVQYIQESVTWVNQVGVPPKTQKKTWRSRKRFVNYTWEKISELTGMSKQDYLYATRTSYNGSVADPSQYILNIAADIEIEGTQYTGKVYINGQEASTFNYRGLITSFGSLCPAYVPVWRLYNTPPDEATITGATKIFSAAANNPITVMAGTTDNWDDTNNVLTYDEFSSERATLIFYYEFGTTGKNENWAQMIDLETGFESSWH